MKKVHHIDDIGSLLQNVLENKTELAAVMVISIKRNGEVLLDTSENMNNLEQLGLLELVKAHIILDSTNDS